MHKVLLVDDEEGYLSLYNHMTAWKKCDFVIAATACHGEDALRKLAKEDFDLVFTDIRMPVLDGIGLLRAIREKGLKDLPVIFASSFSDFSYAQQGITLGLFDYIVKPVTDEMLKNVLDRVNEYLTGVDANKIDRVVLDILDKLNIPLLNDDFVKHIAMYCSEHYKEPFVLGDFAAIFGYNGNYFSSLFKSHFNMTFRTFAGEVKTAYAIDLLRSGQYTVTEVSDMLGFSDLDNFRDAFKKVTGETPASYKPGTKGDEDA